MFVSAPPKPRPLYTADGHGYFPWTLTGLQAPAGVLVSQPDLTAGPLETIPGTRPRLSRVEDMRSRGTKSC